ncbi:uncharacterized protein C2845_PM05G31090 [Panicum miliaceum]|uniref:Btz domain-containing protein n=1 Tax=Panicum miliaceum TaxID=4540 RepID=A0A3L6T5H1_PANMI|nr:uncharacterized protein C2845_PM05G31090 [Panicum miliaceum]
MADREKAEAEAGEEEYESDLDDAPLPALRRRDAASDDEGEEDDEDGGTPLRRRKAGSDADSDGQGAPEVYDEGAYDDGEEEEYEEYEEEMYEEFEEGGGGRRRLASEAVAAAGQEEGEARDGEVEKVDEAAPGEEEKRGNEPYAVPTSGAFYMHDDRFQEGRGRGRGRQRRIVNSRKLWSPKEDQAWVHDRFDEMDVRDFHGDNPKRNQGGRFRGRGGGSGGRTRGISRGNFRGNGSRTYYHDSIKNYSYVPKDSHSYHDNTKNARHALYDNGKNRVPKPSRAPYDNVRNNDIVPKESRTYYGDAKSQKNTPRVARGRGSKRYQPRLRSTTDTSSVQNNKSQSLEDTSSNTNLGQNQAQTSNSRPEQVHPIKQTIASNLNSASPPFYPSRSSNQEFPVRQGDNAQLSSTLLRGKAFVPSVGHVEAAMKGMNRPALHPVALSSNGPFPIATNQANRDYVQPARPVVQQNPVQSPTQSAPRMPAQMFGARFSSSNKISPIQPTSTVLSDDTEISSPSGSNKFDSRLTVKGQPGDQGEEHTSFLYGGAHVLGATGAMGLTLGDQNFHGTPALLPVMQFGGQRPVGPGVPSIGMALPGFVSQQQLGLSNSEMTWLPILTGASGALGAPYGSPYIAVDGSYYPRTSEQASSSVSIRDPSASNASSLLKSQDITEVAGDEPSQRQNKPRRYVNK